MAFGNQLCPFPVSLVDLSRIPGLSRRLVSMASRPPHNNWVRRELHGRGCFQTLIWDRVGTLLFPQIFATEWPASLQCLKLAHPGTPPLKDSGWQAQEGRRRSSLGKLLLLYLLSNPAWTNRG